MTRLDIAVICALAAAFGIHPLETSAQSPEAKETLINKTDMALLGCPVESDSGIYIQRMGERMLNFRNKKGCATNVTSTVVALRHSKDNAEQRWAKVKEGIDTRAKKCKCEPTVSKGTLGERSEIYVFPGEGKARGFEYIMQDRGFIYEVAVYADQPTMSPELEKLVAGKIDRLVAQDQASQ